MGYLEKMRALSSHPASPNHTKKLLAKVEYVLTGEVIKYYPTLRGAKIAATRFNKNAANQSYRGTAHKFID